MEQAGRRTAHPPPGGGWQTFQRRNRPMNIIHGQLLAEQRIDKLPVPDHV